MAPKEAYNWILGCAQNRKLTGLVIYSLLCLDGLLSYVVLLKVPYTEIDWEAYMQQVSQYRAGERDYRNIKGGTGPLVYPAAHVYIYDGLYSLTAGGIDRAMTQMVFWVTYIVTLWLVMLSYRMAKAPPWIFGLLILSKRLHSIYLLRFFNDCFSTLFIFLSIYLLQHQQYTLSALFCSLSIGVKMSSLLYLPAFGLIYVLSTRSTWKAIRLASFMLQVQIVLALPFTASENGSLAGYVGRAFEFSRAFFWEWTVNWRFLGEEIFQSQTFKYFLLGMHISLLIFFFVTRWLGPSGLNIFQFLEGISNGGFEGRGGDEIHRRTTPVYMLVTLFSCNLIGILCARSLHYQFFSWLAWTTPFLLWKSGWGPLFVVPIWAAQEYAWNVFPSTKLSSALAVGCMVLQLIGVWVGTGPVSNTTRSKKDTQKDVLGKMS